MKIIAAFAFLALACASPYSERVKIASPFTPELSTSDESAHIVRVTEPKSYNDIPAANPPYDPNVPILRSNVVIRNHVVANTFEENAAPKYHSPIDMGMIFVPEEVMRAVAAADAKNGERVPLFPSLMPENVMPQSEDSFAVKFAESPMEPEAVRIAEAPENTQPQPVVLPEPAEPYVEYDSVAFNLPKEAEELDVKVLEARRVLPQMQIPSMPFVEDEDNLAVKSVNSPMEPDHFMIAFPLDMDAGSIIETPFEVDQPEELANMAQMPALFQNGNRPYKVYNNPMLR